MKKAFLLCLLMATTIVTAIAQSNCGGKHRIFNVPKDKIPAVITKLGASPQFIPLRYVVNPEVYYKNLKALDKDARYKDEINALFRSIGYTGVADPAFTKDKLVATTIPFGAIGMLGDGNHNYIYSLLALTNQRNIACWLIKPAAGYCNLYIMNECGNAFYHYNPTIERETVKYVERCNGTAKVRVKVYARYSSREECECNDCEGTVYVKEIDEQALLATERIDNIPVMPAKADYPVKKIYIDVDKATFKRIKDYDVNGKYSKSSCSGSCQHDCSNGCSSECGDSCHK
ncbi:hypothetical protein CAP35_13460 [Chitinophagaceae bacterium IBVUCB1]|nr:hypothetical protein CAP35_13460 [Chitinophagaceae bacterium IBVUCB1]